MKSQLSIKGHRWLRRKLSKNAAIKGCAIKQKTEQLLLIGVGVSSASARRSLRN